MGIDYNLIPIISLGITGILLLVLATIIRTKEKEKTILKKYINKEISKETYFKKVLNSSKIISNFEKNVEKKYAIALTSDFTPRKVTKLMFLAVLVGFLFMWVIGNVIVFPLILAICYFIPLLYLDLVVKSKKNKIESQLGVAINFFITEFTTTKSVSISIQNIIPKLSNPIKNEFEKLLRELNSGVLPKESFQNFAKRVDNKFALIFADLLTSYFDKGTDFCSHLLGIAEDISDSQIQRKEGQTENAMMRTTNFILNGVLFVTIFVIFLFLPRFSECFKDTIRGQFLMAVVVLSSFLSIVLGFKMKRN